MMGLGRSEHLYNPCKETLRPHAHVYGGCCQPECVDSYHRSQSRNQVPHSLADCTGHVKVCLATCTLNLNSDVFSDSALSGGGLRALCQVWAYARRRRLLKRNKCRSPPLQFEQFQALALFPHPAVHHVRVDAVTQRNAGKRCAWLTTLLQHANLELRAVLTPPRALYCW